jgi:large subunit ribosomal protein L21
MFAVIKTGGKQYRVAAEDVLRLERLAAQPGAVVEFGEVLVVGGEATLLGTPTVAGATVAGELIEHGRGAKVIAFKKRRRKNSRRKRGHRQQYSLVRITEILTQGRRPSPTPPPRPQRSSGAEASDSTDNVPPPDGETASAAAEPVAAHGAASALPGAATTAATAAPASGTLSDVGAAGPAEAAEGEAADKGDHHGT